MSIVFGAHTFSSPDIKLSGLDSGQERVSGQQFISGGYRSYSADVLGQEFELSAMLDSTGDKDRLHGVIRWADILGLLALPSSPQSFSHPRLESLGISSVTAVFDKTSLDGLTFYAPHGQGEPVNPTTTTTYPHTDTLLMWYGVLRFRRMS